MGKRVFVTVGSTQFDKLIEEVTRSSVLEVLSNNGYDALTLQIGKGNFIPDNGIYSKVNIEVFRYKDNLLEEFKKADLVISHAGAASCIEALEDSKPLIAVINDSLMNNHQEELAEALSDLGCCEWCYINTLMSTLVNFDACHLQPYTSGNPQRIVEYIDSVFFKTES